MTTPPGELMIRATVMPADANPYGSAFVGWLMGQMALAAGALVSRETGARAPVVAADGFSFTAPVAVGDEVSCHAEVASRGTRSWTVAVTLWGRPRHGGQAAPAAQGRFTLVAINDPAPPDTGA
ncbi:hotdog domain-containing protein [Sphingomonas sp.]|uniref:acyl-CoA thioesterase n=1 Tax=Sphingomonas sp. TaxID=28214 RepID=UPI001D360F84|nr:hotdog domain-containing protein [Sphingomonas sp.]MBX9797315.1 acyl-CoA thioesterase [Sphingomonas sp.]